MVEPADAADGQQNVPIDAAMAVAFADFMDHREVLGILSRYGKGYTVTLIKGHGLDKDKPSYRVVIYKLVKDASLVAEDGPDYVWQADGLGSTLLFALKSADRNAQTVQNR